MNSEVATDTIEARDIDINLEKVLRFHCLAETTATVIHTLKDIGARICSQKWEIIKQTRQRVMVPPKDIVEK
ncbi:hypothetical protein LguiA_011782 [Lonicera macranthoides]